jgi:hypothetical protein
LDIPGDRDLNVGDDQVRGGGDADIGGSGAVRLPPNQSGLVPRNLPLLISLIPNKRRAACLRRRPSLSTLSGRVLGPHPLLILLASDGLQTAPRSLCLLFIPRHGRGCPCTHLFKHMARTQPPPKPGHLQFRPHRSVSPRLHALHSLTHPSAAGTVLGVLYLVTFAVSIGAIVQPVHITIGLVALNWTLLMDTIVTTVVGSMVWFYTLQERANFREVFARQSEPTRQSIQDLVRSHSHSSTFC